MAQKLYNGNYFKNNYATEVKRYKTLFWALLVTREVLFPIGVLSLGGTFVTL